MSKKNQGKTTETRIAANRRNAQKSTGPRTKEGKRKASMNRYQHGFYAAPDKRTREEMFRIGEDPDLLEHFERKLTLAWQPSDDMQAMVVADLARLYADQAHMRKVVRATRLGELREQETAIQQVDLALSHEDAISELDLKDLGYRGMEPCQTALDESRRLLDDLFTRNAMRLWNKDFSASAQPPSEIFALLYGQHPHGVGRMIIDLFNLLAEHPEKADLPLEDPEYEEEETANTGEPQGGPRPAPPDFGPAGTLRLQLATCIEKERMAVMFEERHYHIRKAAELVDFGSEWLPGGENWGKVQVQEARANRMIEGKIKILIRLKRLRHSLPEEFDDGLGGIDGDGNSKFETRPVPTGSRKNSKIDSSFRGNDEDMDPLFRGSEKGMDSCPQHTTDDPYLTTDTRPLTRMLSSVVSSVLLCALCVESFLRGPRRLFGRRRADACVGLGRALLSTERTRPYRTPERADCEQLTTDCGPRTENKMLKSEVRSHQVVEKKGSQFGTKPKCTGVGDSGFRVRGKQETVRPSATSDPEPGLREGRRTA